MELVLDHVTKAFGGIRAVDAATLTVPEGEFVCLLGPSGCGKTTLLRMIAGLEEPSEGRLVFGGTDLTHVPAHQRDFGMVFQSLALFPHLTVGENIAYPLTIRGAGKAEREARVAELLALVQLPGFGDRPVAKLSGGQRQRIAIARALAVSPKLFLLDEPLSALDAKLREAMQVELRQLQRQLGITTIVVTHDQREAMTLADRIVVMKAGRVQQVGPPLEVYRRPANTFVADFIGETNLIGDGAAGRAALGLPASGSTLSLRPENIHLAGADGDGDGLEARVAFVRDLGATREVRLDTALGPLTATLPRSAGPVEVGATVALKADVDAAHPVEDAP